MNNRHALKATIYIWQSLENYDIKLQNSKIESKSNINANMLCTKNNI